MKYVYYPGCSLNSTAQEFNDSTQAVCAKLGIELEEIKDWNCCGASSAHATNKFLTSALPLRNLILTEKQGNSLVVPCAACYNSMRATEGYMRAGSEEAVALNREVGEIMGTTYQNGVQVSHVVDMFTKPEVIKLVAEKVVKPLAGLKLAAYYGCLLTRPPKAVAFEENHEQPQKMDLLVSALGAESVRWTHKTACCGAGLSISQPDLVINLTDKIVAAAKRAGADALVTACPMCMANLDTRQTGVQEGRTKEVLPAFYITELLGIALNLTGTEAWLKKHIINPFTVLSSLNQASA